MTVYRLMLNQNVVVFEITFICSTFFDNSDLLFSPIFDDYFHVGSNLLLHRRMLD